MKPSDLYAVVIFFASLLSCLLYSQNIAATPLLAVNQILWNDKIKLVLANCSKASEVSDSKICCLPKPSDDHTFEFLDLAILSENNQHSIFAISTEKNQSVSILYHYDLKEDGTLSKGTPLLQLKFGAQTAKLGIYSNAIRDRNVLPGNDRLEKIPSEKREASQKAVLTLIANANDKLTQKLQSYAMAFEVFQGQLQPFDKYSAGMQGNFEQITSMTMLKPENEGRVLALGGLEVQDKSRLGVLKFIFLDALKAPLVLKTNNASALTYLIALDQYQKNNSDVLYAWDQSGGVWRKDLSSIFHTSLQKVYDSSDLMLESTSLSIIKAVKSLKSPGISFYILGQKTQDMAKLYCLEIPKQGKPLLRSVLEGNVPFCSVFTRFGRLILVPKLFSDLKEGIQVFDLGPKTESRLKIHWTNVQAAYSGGSESQKSARQALESQKSENEKSTSQELESQRSERQKSTSQELESQKFESQKLKSQKPEGMLPTLKSPALVQNFLLWDPKQQKEVLVSLSQNCFITVHTAGVTQDKYTRMVWQKGNEAQ